MIVKARVMIPAVTVAAAVALAVGHPSWSASATRTPRGGAGDPTQVIDAKTDPAAASKALNDFCDQLANCKFVGGTPTTGYGPPRVLGDALYNCGQGEQSYAEDSVAISDERSESTTLSESLSAKVSAGLIGLAKQSIEAEVDSKQMEEVSTTTTDENSVSLQPGWKGWTQSRISSAYVAGDAYVTDGIHLIKVTDIDVSFPGYAALGTAGITYDGYRTPMTDADRQQHCAILPGQSGVKGALKALAPESLPVVLCTRKPATPPPAFAGSVGVRPRRFSCVSRHAVGNMVLTAGATKAKLARGRRTYAVGTARKRGIVLYARRKVGSGTYTLRLTRPHLITVGRVTLR